MRAGMNIKIQTCIYLLLLISSLHKTMIADSPCKTQEKLIIGCHSKHAGFFSCFFGVINNIIWCEKNGVTPLVYWGHDSLYYAPSGYHSSTNVWQYYFIQPSYSSFINKDIRKNYNAPDDSYTILRHDSCSSFQNSKELRKNVHRIIQKYIKLKPQLSRKIDNFYAKHMAGKKIIGIHLRGTDKKKEVDAIDPKIILKEANKLARKITGCTFLVATDEAALLRKAKLILDGPVIYYNAHRSNDSKSLHHYGQNKPRLGEEVIIEAQLLSRCDIFLHTCSNVSSAVLFFNPELENILFTHEGIHYGTEETAVQ